MTEQKPIRDLTAAQASALFDKTDDYVSKLARLGYLDFDKGNGRTRLYNLEEIKAARIKYRSDLRAKKRNPPTYEPCKLCSSTARYPDGTCKGCKLAANEARRRTGRWVCTLCGHTKRNNQGKCVLCCDQLAREKREAKETADRAAVTYEEKHTTPRADLDANWAGNGQSESALREQIRQRVAEEDEATLRRAAAVSRNGIIDPRAGSFTARMAARSDAKEFGDGGSVGRAERLRKKKERETAVVYERRRMAREGDDD